jgi:hypothetical protein
MRHGETSSSAQETAFICSRCPLERRPCRCPWSPPPAHRNKTRAAHHETNELPAAQQSVEEHEDSGRTNDKFLRERKTDLFLVVVVAGARAEHVLVLVRLRNEGARQQRHTAVSEPIQEGAVGFARNRATPSSQPQAAGRHECGPRTYVQRETRQPRGRKQEKKKR